MVRNSLIKFYANSNLLDMVRIHVPLKNLLTNVTNMIGLLIIHSLAVGFIEGSPHQLFTGDNAKPYLVLNNKKHVYKERNGIEHEVYRVDKKDKSYKVDRGNLLELKLNRNEIGEKYGHDTDDIDEKLNKKDRGKLHQKADIFYSEKQPVTLEDCLRSIGIKRKHCLKFYRRHFRALSNQNGNLDSYTAKGIYNIITVLEKINMNIATALAIYKNQTSPPVNKKARRKREVTYTTETENVEETTVATIDIETSQPNTTAETLNKTQEVDLEKTNATLSNDTINGRRSFVPLQNEKASVKNKLLSYLDDTYKEIVNKIAPIQTLKQAFSSNDLYKIGYLIANVDTLEVNIKDLKQDLDLNKDFWDDDKILDLFDKLLQSNKIVTNLLNSLNAYVERTASNTPVPQISFKI